MPHVTLASPIPALPVGYGYRGSCNSTGPWTTFSVCVFPWLPRASGGGIKKGRAVTRIVGNTSEPHHVEELARIVVGLLTQGRILPRTLNVYAATARRIRYENATQEGKEV